MIPIPEFKKSGILLGYCLSGGVDLSQAKPTSASSAHQLACSLLVEGESELPSIWGEDVDMRRPMVVREDLETVAVMLDRGHVS
jgi:hypothetical protein